MLQLMIENGFEIEHQTPSTAAVELQQPRKIDIPKTSEIREILLEKYSKDTEGFGLSPSAINTFLACKLKFYLRYVIGLEARKPEVSDLGAAAIGTWFHRSAEILYRKITNQLEFDEKNRFLEFTESLITAEQLEVYKDDKKREHLVDMASIYEKHHANKSAATIDWSSNPEHSGEELIVRRLLSDNLKRLISLDIHKAPFTLLAMEKQVSEIITIGDIAIKMGGYIDRIDNIDGYLRVVDYKTGGRFKPLNIDKLQNLFDETKIADNRNFLQALVYSLMISKTAGNRRVQPCLVHVHEAHKAEHSVAFLPNDYNEISAEFEDYFTTLLQEMFDPNTIFCATETSANCRYCDYLGLCRKSQQTW
jgi:CRISPR/Cas system-associated exonuclease Cas4 (RecB family)